jgi:4,5-dihydroxyphthalate decarboxylase
MLKMKVGFSPNPRLDPLIDGRIKPQNIELDFAVMSPGELFYRNLMYDEFDVFEMSISEFLMVMANPAGSRWHWSALPVFPRKAFNWLNLSVRVDAGIKSPADLKGKRVGVPDYPMTAALWMRIFLDELYGVKPSDVVWYIGRNQQLSHGGALGLHNRPPARVSLRWLTGEQTLDVMLDQGELDAAFWISPPADPVARGAHNIDRYGGTRLEGNPRIRKLFPDGGRGMIAEYHKKTGVVPANHIVVIQKRILAEHPWAARELLDAFQRAKETAYQAGDRRDLAYLLFAGDDPEQQRLAFGDDPYPFGVKQNRRMIEIAARSSHEEGLTPKLVPVDMIFDPATLDT